MLQENFSPGVACLAFLTAVVLAPVFEEMLFRGLIQSWLVKAFDRLDGRLRPARSNQAPAPPSRDMSILADSLADITLADPDLDRFPPGPDPENGYWEAESEPPNPVRVDDLQADAAKSCDIPDRPRSPFWTGAAIALTSLIFASLHAAQWPAPIPLFLLALGLGVVYQRTGGLIAPICMHAIFNGFSTLMLFYVALDRPDKEKPPVQPVLERVAPVEKAGEVTPDVGPQPQRGKT
jgi:hypothetical protein